LDFLRSHQSCSFHGRWAGGEKGNEEYSGENMAEAISQREQKGTEESMKSTVIQVIGAGGFLPFKLDPTGPSSLIAKKS
jgi:hypothetical protein